MIQDKRECVVLNVKDLVNEDNAAAEEDIILPSVGKIRVQNI